MAGLALPVGAANGAGGMAAAQPVAEQLRPGEAPKKDHQFDVIVWPHARCRLVFEAIKNEVFSGMKVADTSKYWCKWTKTSAAITQPTTLHVTIPGKATSYTFVVHTDKACNSSLFSTGFSSTAIEVREYVSSLHQPRNQLDICDYAKAKSKLPKDAAEQTIVVDQLVTEKKKEEKKE